MLHSQSQFLFFLNYLICIMIKVQFLVFTVLYLITVVDWKFEMQIAEAAAKLESCYDFMEALCFFCQLK